jgi:hypothetical protein
MAWWTAYSKDGASADDVVFLRDGFRWWALIFPFPWLVIQGMWIVLVIALAAQFLIWAVAEALGFGEAMRVIAGLAINLILGFEGSNLLRWTYERRGLSERGLIEAPDLETAEYRFFSEIGLPALPEVAEPPASPPLGTSRNWKAQTSDFIFPGFSRP